VICVVLGHLNDKKNQKIRVCHSQKLFKKVERYKGDNVVLGSYHYVVLSKRAAGLFHIHIHS
jgi:hypothetical protein